MNEYLDYIYKKSLQNNKQLYEKTMKSIKEYDILAEDLSNKSIQNLKKYCSEVNNKLKNYHEYHKLNIDSPSPMREVYDKCKRFYTHDVSEFLEYNNNKFNYLISQFSEKISICDEKYENIKETKDIQECYEKEGLKYLLRLDDFIYQSNLIAKKKYEYLVEVDK